MTETSRWRPTRAGILNVWRYYDEIFTFHKGRLLVRGPNGSGKSKALELLLPYLLDADIRATRLSTFGTRTRTMHWNLMGEGTEGQTRVGYLWLEFGNGDGDWFTCGVRLQASNRDSKVNQDYFTADTRIGLDDGPSLKNPTGSPLSVRELKALLGDGVCERDVYRDRIRRRLFGELSPSRYDSLINALLQLRTPKLSERLDPKALSVLLSKALPPLKEDEIGELAEGFERLDRHGERIKGLETQLAAAKSLRDRQRAYAQRILRAASAELVRATNDMDAATRDTRLAGEGLGKVTGEIERLLENRESDERRQAECEAAVVALKDSEDYRGGGRLDRLREQSSNAFRKAAEERDRAGRQRSAADRVRAELGTAKSSLTRAQEQVADRAAAARRAAETAGLEHVVGEMAGQQGTARLLLRAAVDSRLGQVRAVGKAVVARRSAEELRASADKRVDDDRRDLEAAYQALQRARSERDAESESYGDRLVAWTGACTLLRFDESEVTELRDAVGDDGGVRTVAHRVAQRAVAEAATETATAERRRVELQADRAATQAGLDDLMRTKTVAPSVPPTRSAERGGRPGAPLWRLVAFRDDVPASVQAGVESALEASGLLDAWLDPAGTARVEGHDTFAVPLGTTPATSLAEILTVEEEPAVDAERVRAVLAGIAYGPSAPEAASGIGADGTWRLGSAHGSWAKSQPQYIGASARERHRAARVAELREHLAVLDTALSAATVVLDELAARRERLDAEQRAIPSGSRLAELTRSAEQAAQTRAERERAVAASRDRVTEAEGGLRAAHARVDMLAAEHGLPAEEPGLDSVRTAVQRFGDLAGEWLEAAARAADATVRRDTAAGHVSEAETLQRELDASAREAAIEAAELAEQVAQLDATVGATVREIEARIAGLREESGRLKGAIRLATERHVRLSATQATFKANLDAADKRRHDTTETRDAVAARFRDLLGGALREDARLDIRVDTDDRVKATLQAARDVAVKLEKTPHRVDDLSAAHERLRDTVHELRPSLSGHADLEFRPDGEVQHLVVTADGVRMSATALFDRLDAERRRAKEELTEEERELFEQILTGQTRGNLAERIREADQQVKDMNARLEKVRTASNVAVKLVWKMRADLEAGAKQARELLLKNPGTLTQDQNQALRDFLRHRVDSMRESDDPLPWHDQLRRVFDYTQWHEFEVQLDRGAGWVKLSKSLHDALSGGEKAIALHLPLFAAVAVHYQSSPSSPRFILLDEVFVGVDRKNRGQVFALMSSMDLDMALTSDHEWCEYPELDGIAVHTILGADDTDDAVTTMRYTWDGHGLVAEDEEEGVLF
ncbi:TIGR02680 family protein [Phytomonospora sp. NPDC050363]|uniref:TIGR02680 family protein n=1 Tax=Phytomonospora sp. NPDC050363 TaxID=3155642 RepID=UPI0033FCF644